VNHSAAVAATMAIQDGQRDEGLVVEIVPWICIAHMPV